MKKRIVLSALIGAGLVGIFYPAPDLFVRIVAVVVSFFVLLGVLFCTMMTGLQDVARRMDERDQVTAEEKTATESK